MIPDEYEAQVLQDDDPKQPCLTSFETEDNSCTENERIQIDGSRVEFHRHENEDVSKLLENNQLLLADELNQKLKILVNQKTDTEVDQDGKYANWPLPNNKNNKNNDNIDLECSKPPLPPKKRITIPELTNHLNDLNDVKDEENPLEPINGNTELKLPEKSNAYNLPPIPKRLPKGRVLCSYKAMKTGDINISVDDNITILNEGKLILCYYVFFT